MGKPSKKHPPGAVEEQVPGRRRRRDRQGSGTERTAGRPPGTPPGAGLWPRFTHLLATPVSGASLAVFRIALGLIVVLEAYALCRPDPSALSTGLSPLETFYTGADIRFHFPYPGFEWLPLLPAPLIRVLVGVLALSGITLALGLWYRASAVAVFVTWGYLWLVESTRTYWQSHYYLEFLVTFLMLWLPAARRYSLDAWRSRGRPLPATIPFWPVLLLRGQLVIAYFYAGVAKLNADWLLDAVPVRWFLARPSVTEPFAPYLPAAPFAAFQRLVGSVEFAYVISYAGLIFDLAVGFLLLFRRTRWFAMLLMVLFHAANHLLIFDDIGWFPLLGVTTALIFLAPDWPERFWRRLRRLRPGNAGESGRLGGLPPTPAADVVPGPGHPVITPAGAAGLGHRLARWTAPCVLAWLVWQAAMPLRHFLIPGDARFTYEGLSFSWRLKSETHHAFRHQLFIQDAGIISADGAGGHRINWSEWRGEPVIHRQVEPGQINWRALPEILTVVEPVVGERILYNPHPAGSRTEADARRRLDLLWRELHGREPQGVEVTRSFPQVLESMAAVLRKQDLQDEAARYAGLASNVARLERGELPPGDAARTLEETGALLRRLPGRDELVPELRRLNPFGLEGEVPSHLPFLVVNDPLVLEPAPAGRPARVAPGRWKPGPATREPARPPRLDVGGEPRVVYLGELGPAERELLPQACIVDHQRDPRRAPRIWWNSARDLTASKLVHISSQAFYLRRYARRVADRWEAERGRRPVINALTALSLNGRPHQELVDPRADLASVPTAWFGHNAWIRDLKTPRIPPAALEDAKGSVGQ